MSLSKLTLRQCMREKLKGLSRHQKIIDQSSLVNRLCDWRESASSVVGSFVASSQEPDLTEINKFGKVFLPRFSPENQLYDLALWDRSKELVLGPYQIPEPNQAALELKGAEMGFCLIPGLAFTETGHRLGRGGGFYDRLLVKYNVGIKVGVCFDFQICKEIPLEEHDLSMDYIVTPSRIIKCGLDNE